MTQEWKNILFSYGKLDFIWAGVISQLIEPGEDYESRRLIIIVSDNDLSPIRRLDITREKNAGVLSIGPYRSDFS